MVCPKARPIWDQFHQPVGRAEGQLRAALTVTGKAENYESGRWLLHTYRGVNISNISASGASSTPRGSAGAQGVGGGGRTAENYAGASDAGGRAGGRSSSSLLGPAGAWKDDGETFFYSERMNRNVVACTAMTQGMWPQGTGEAGFVSENPNYVPILTSTPFQDTIMNLPRDGPCKKKFAADKKAWSMVGVCSLSSIPCSFCVL